MGNIISALAGVAKSIKSIISAFRSISADYNALLARVNSPAGLPVDSPTESYWFDQPPFPELVNAQSPVFPEEADVVIIGSGITGAAVARTILHEWRRKGEDDNKRVVVLEARQICSGATGRNGGHIKASPHEMVGRLQKKMSPDRAASLVRFQLRHLETLVGLCSAESIDVAECREVETVDYYVEESLYEEAVKQIEYLRKWVPEFKMTAWTASEAQKRFSVNHFVVGAISYKAGALWPYRFVTSIWKSLLNEFPEKLSIETHTPVSTVTSTPDSEFPLDVTTNRGVIRSRHVVHATNAFASHLVPGFRGKMTSLLAHMSAQRPGKNFPDHNGQRSWSVIYGNGFDYATQRPTTAGVPGDIMIGGGFGQSKKQGLDQLGVYDDSKIDALTAAHILGIMPTIFESNWAGDIDGRAKKVWTGVVALTADFLPFVGRLDPRLTGRKATKSSRAGQSQAGEWTAAGFVGDGMVWAWLSGTALGVMIAGSEDEDLPTAPGRPAGRLRDWFPDELLPTHERIKRMDVADLADGII